MSAEKFPIGELISVIIPCYNEAQNIEQTLKEIYKYFDKFVPNYEVIVVVEKSTDNTLEVINSSKNQKTIVLENERKFGKGYSLRRGIYFAKGQYILTCDADLPVDIKKYFPSMLELLRKDEKVAAVFATALAIKTCRRERGFVRSVVSLIFFVLRQLFLQFPVSDTQLGFKLFRADVAKKCCQKVNENGFLFDLILTDLMLNAGYQIEEINVKVVERKIKSSVSVGEIIKTTCKFCKYILFTRSKLLRKCTDKVMINDKSKGVKASSI
ncbi:glycosyltransferase family 2 protein [Caldicellulosiruptor changbaiensis]|uniref:Glycosyltransferase family 2 protein n=1 Tax=Caldicellulosiruptor changbaiensis TaxID=1222016 RepID=A0A3T0D8F6_9FIRM|nr:glycosyltransferase family 2 protein [Caldicellulosiruptor changbaiensis]AZT91427.1 glycosyltransferase family 2 protein [Caldicellulosiruptor changbaiensis]